VSSQAAAAPGALGTLGMRLRRAADWVLALRPAYVLGVLLCAQWAAVLVFALTVRHNGWLYYSGGDQLWHYTGAYLLDQGYQPPGYVGYGWSMLLLPLVPFTGANLVSALPVIVLFNTLVLLPLALLCVYGIASRIAGRLFGYWAAGLWIALPYFGILFIEPGYHQKYTELTLPHLLGLTAMSDFPTMVGLLVSAYLCLRALEGGSWITMGAAGFAAGYAIAVKPSSSIFLFAPAVLILVSRWRALLPFAVGLAPALATLALWKYRGLGHLGAADTEQLRLATGLDDLLRRIHNPEANSWRHFQQNIEALREHFWVSRILEWLPLAGAIALATRARRGFLLVVPWFFAFLAIKGSYEDAGMDDASFFRILLPAFPAFLLLVASIPLLFPGVRARAAPLGRPALLRGRRLLAAVAAAIAVFAIYPVVVIASAIRVVDEFHMLDYSGTLVPIRDLGVRMSRDGDTVRLTWKRQNTRPAEIFYSVLRTSDPRGGVTCAHVPNSTIDCGLSVENAFPTRTTAFTDKPAKGTWTYRVSVFANWLNDEHFGDMYVVSPPVTVNVR
jgi:hypothetical protein